MKKIIAGGIACLLIVIACHRKTVPVAAEKPVQPPVAVQPVIAAADLDIEAGKKVYETKCVRCHAAKPVENYTATRWVGILRSMVPRSKLDSVQTAQLTLYVNAHAKKS